MTMLRKKWGEQVGGEPRDGPALAALKKQNNVKSSLERVITLP